MHVANLAIKDVWTIQYEILDNVLSQHLHPRDKFHLETEKQHYRRNGYETVVSAIGES